MAEIEKLTVKIEADFAQLKRELKKAGAGFEGLGDEAKKAGAGLKGTATGFLGIIKRVRADLNASKWAIAGVSAAVVGLGLSIHKTATEFKELERASKRIGIATEEFSKLATVAKKSGIDTETLADAMKDLNVKITDASLGAKAYEDVFRQLGLRSSELVKLDPAEQFFKFADAIKKADGNVRRFALDEINDAMFQMLPLMEQGGDRLRELAKQAGEMGQAIDKKEAASMREYNKAMNELGAAAEHLAQEVSEHFLPAMTSMATLVSDSVTGLAEIISSSNELADALKEIKEEAMETNAAFNSGNAIMSSGSVAMSGLASNVDDATLSLEAMNEQMEALKGAGEGVSVAFTGDDSGFQVPGIEDPKAPDIGSMFAEALGGDSSGNAGNALEKALAENEAKKEAQAAHNAKMLNLQFEHMLEMGEQDAALQAEEEARQQKFYDREFGWAEKHIERMKRLEKMGFKGRMRMSVEFLDNIATITQGRSRKMFEITKAAQTGEAIINTIGGVTKALNNPYPVNLAFAASVAAAGAAQIAKIQSTQFGGGGGGGAGSFSAASPSPAAAGGGEEAGSVIDATFNIQSESGNVSADQIRGVAAGLNELIEDGGKLRSVTVI